MQKTDLKSILQSGYNRPQWISTLQFLSGNGERLTVFLEPKQIELHTKKAQNVARVLSQIGTLKTKEGDVLPLFEVELQKNTHIEHNRVGVNELIKDFILHDAKRGALVTYHYLDNHPQEWRFSFISKYGGSDFFEEAESVETNPKKYTYIFGSDEEHRTAIERLLILKASEFKLEDFFEAFNVEPISTGFFKEYKRFYVDFVRSISGEEISKKEWRQVEEPSAFYTEVFEGDSKEVRNFVKRLLGRLVFLYFLQKKRWLGAASQNYDDGDTNFLQNLFKYEQTDPENFYADWLAKLFFDTLNNPERTGEAFNLPSGSSSCVPFLNGGLFEEQQEPENHRTLKFPDYLFEELFAFFNSYNFTIYENSPEDHTIAVDPEMLGNIFENLLEDNNAKGTFYTPKEIVHYMTQESLIEYLSTQMPGKKRNSLVELVKNQTRDDFNRNELKTVFEKIDTVKICDPAIGSGAFPMGLLQEIFSLKAFLNYEEGFGVKSPAIIKQNIIQNSIYGVDIEPGAIDIARLRFWLSLVVDEPIPKPLPNLDYKIMQGDSLREQFDGIDLSRVSSGNNVAIANAQTDIFGNLIDGQLEVTFDKAGTPEEIQKLTQQYFTASVLQKPELKSQINRLVHDFIEYNIELREQQLSRFMTEVKSQKTRNTRIEKQLKLWQKKSDELDLSRKKLHDIQNKDEHPYFLWHLFFKDVFDEGGFDIVIGNPPYIQLQSLGEYADHLQEEKYATYARTGDIYCLFYEKGFDLLKKKGVLSYITSNMWMRAGYGLAMRDYFLNKTNPIQIIDFGDESLFENATTYTNIYIGKRETKQGDGDVWDLSKNFERQKSLDWHLNHYDHFQADFSLDAFLILTEQEYFIKKEVERIGTPLKEWGIDINYGIKTGFNDAFIIPQSVKEQLIKEEPKSADFIKPVLAGRDVHKYSLGSDDSWLIFIPWHFPLHKEEEITGASSEAEDLFQEQFPVVFRHLSKYENQLRSRNRSETGIRYEWYALQRCAASYYDEFDKPKIIWGNLNKYATFSIDVNGTYINAPTNLLTAKSDDVSIKYLTGVLNSKLTTLLMRKIGYERRGGYVEYKKVFVERLPIPRVSKKEEESIEKLVEYILVLHAIGEKNPINEYVPNSHIISEFEGVIDALVIELYFSEQFKTEGLAFGNYVQRDFAVISELESVSEKKRIIHEAYQKLREKNNEIRNNLKRMRIDLRDLVMPILSV